MLKQTGKDLPWHLNVIVLAVIFVGCVSSGPTIPNLPYQGPDYPLYFSELAEENPLLAKELGKLPETQTGISEQEAATLKTLVDIYKDDPEVFDSAFKNMYIIRFA